MHILGEGRTQTEGRRYRMGQFAGEGRAYILEAGADKTLPAQLRELDASLLFLAAVIASVLLSFWTVTVQRRSLCLALRGEGEEEVLPSTYPARRTGSAMLIGGLGFFLELAAKGWCGARESGDPARLRSAESNLLASILVLAAAVLRYRDLNSTEVEERCRAASGRNHTEGGAL